MPQVLRQCDRCGAEIAGETAELTSGLCLSCRLGHTVSVDEAEAIAQLAADFPPLPNSSSNVMGLSEASTELVAAAAALQIRVRILRVPANRIAIDEWAGLNPDLREFVPQWLRDMLSKYSLYGLVLEIEDSGEDYSRFFSFIGPDSYNALLEGGSLYRPLLSNGFVPVGAETNGDLWVIEKPFAQNSKVYLLERSAWGGGTPGTTQGLRFAASRLSLLLCTMAISQSSYENAPNGVASLLWWPDRAHQ